MSGNGGEQMIGPWGRFPAAALCLLLLVVVGCASHSRRTEEARSALDELRPKRALELLNKELQVDGPEDLPANVTGDQTLLILDRAMVLQQLGEYELSSRDLEVADKSIELLDFSRNALDDVGKYLFSDSSGPYRAPAYEKLMINTMNMVNYLVRGDLNGSRVEARRLAVMQKFIEESKDPADALLGPGSYLAGFTFEKSGKADEALRYYDEALQYGSYGTLREPVRRLGESSSYSSPRLRKLLGTEKKETKQSALEKRAPLVLVLGDAYVRIAPLAAKEGDTTEAKPVSAEGSSAEVTPVSSTDGASRMEAAGAEGPASAATAASRPADDTGELMVIVGFGRVPEKIPQRVPIGLALTYCSGILSPYDVNRANELALQGLVTWVNYPEMGEPRGTWGRPTWQIGTKWQRLEGLIAVDKEAYRAFDAVKGSIVASAITRMLARVAAGQVAKEAAGKDNALGILLSLGTQAALTAADKPDTRSWSTLPARLAVGRVRLAPGRYEIALNARGFEKQQTVTIRPRGWVVANLTALN